MKGFSKSATTVWIAAAVLVLAAAGTLVRIEGLRLHRQRPALAVTGTWRTPLQYGMSSISGRIRNNTSQPFDSVGVEIVVSNARRDSVGSYTVRLQHLRPAEEREFETWLLPERPEKYSVRRVWGNGVVITEPARLFN